MDEKIIKNDWRYFLYLEKDLENTAKYVEPQGQENVYSLEFFRIAVLALTEIESVFKQICVCINGKSTYGNIGDYKQTILEKYPKICDTQIEIPICNKTIKPFENWNNGKLEWWDLAEGLKHDRYNKFTDANFDLCINMLAGLYVLILYLYKMNSCTFHLESGGYICSEYLDSPVYFSRDQYLPDFSDNVGDAIVKISSNGDITI